MFQLPKVEPYFSLMLVAFDFQLPAIMCFKP